MALYRQAQGSGDVGQNEYNLDLDEDDVQQVTLAWHYRGFATSARWRVPLPTPTPMPREGADGGFVCPEPASCVHATLPSTSIPTTTTTHSHLPPAAHRGRSPRGLGAARRPAAGVRAADARHCGAADAGAAAGGSAGRLRAWHAHGGRRPRRPRGARRAAGFGAAADGTGHYHLPGECLILMKKRVIYNACRVLCTGVGTAGAAVQPADTAQPPASTAHPHPPADHPTLLHFCCLAPLAGGQGPSRRCRGVSPLVALD